MLHIQLRKSKRIYKKTGRLRITLCRDYKRFRVLGYIQKSTIFPVSSNKQYFVKFIYFNLSLYAYWRNVNFKLPLWLTRLIPLSLIEAVFYHKIYVYYIEYQKYLSSILLLSNGNKE